MRTKHPMARALALVSGGISPVLVQSSPFGMKQNRQNLSLQCKRGVDGEGIIRRDDLGQESGHQEQQSAEGLSPFNPCWAWIYSSSLLSHGEKHFPEEQLLRKRHRARLGAILPAASPLPWAALVWPPWKAGHGDVSLSREDSAPSQSDFTSGHISS